jgi:phenylalanyl-tRNA synthetase beta chain
MGQDGFVMELGLTPNRSDLLSVLGYAYDLAAMTNQKIELPSFDIKKAQIIIRFK